MSEFNVCDGDVVYRRLADGLVVRVTFSGDSVRLRAPNVGSHLSVVHEDNNNVEVAVRLGPNRPSGTEPKS